MKKVAIVTSTRAEFGLLRPVITELRKYENPGFSVELIVTGTHLYPEYGMTIDEIHDQDIRIDHEIRVPVDSGSSTDISNNQAEILKSFTQLFVDQEYDAVLLLGDRYETLAQAIAAMNTRTPIIHLCGGDITEGAMDDSIRHAITKMSYLHFTTNEESRRRVIQMGEDPARVFNFGSTSIDNIVTIADMTKAEALRSVGMAECRYALCTYHPVTLEDTDVDAVIGSFMEAIKAFPDLEFIITKSNSDQGGARINELLDEYQVKTNNIKVFASLGSRRYLSLMRHAEFVLGNSSSGIIETPAFHIPTVNIGDRQKGRLRADSIIECGEDTDAIVNAMKKAMSSEMKKICEETISQYGDGTSGKRIAQKIYEIIREKIDLRKSFYAM
ncbi:MAG: UDP-N-acetylglucosamine 2-epimerase (hydrolyzing) [Lachnospiraceae bacterium]|nr:UDP-N-acetylglucosamine 2-epimerase (hydrolyzing) [Lachnospiraceae bacterium]